MPTVNEQHLEDIGFHWLEWRTPNLIVFYATLPLLTVHLVAYIPLKMLYALAETGSGKECSDDTCTFLIPEVLVRLIISRPNNSLGITYALYITDDFFWFKPLLPCRPVFISEYAVHRAKLILSLTLKASITTIVVCFVFCRLL